MKKRVLVLLIMFLIVFISGCGNNSKLEEKNNQDEVINKDELLEEKLEAKKEYYRDMLSNFNYGEISFIDNCVDSQGVYAWKNASEDINKFENEYKNLEVNYISKTGTYHRLHDVDTSNDTKLLMLEDTSYNVFRALSKLYSKLELDGDVKVEQLNDNFNKVTVNMKKLTDNSSILFEFIFYNDKIVDIKFKENDGSKTDLFVTEYTKMNSVNNKISGRYIKKVNENDILSDIQAEFIFNEDGTVIYNVFSLKGSVPSKYNLKGTYEVDEENVIKKINMIMDKRVYDDENQIDLEDALNFHGLGTYMTFRVSGNYFMYQAQ